MYLMVSTRHDPTPTPTPTITVKPIPITNPRLSQSNPSAFFSCFWCDGCLLHANISSACLVCHASEIL